MTTNLVAVRLTGGDSQGGIGTKGDVLVNKTNDGVEVNSLWAEWETVVSLYNDHKDALLSLMAFDVTVPADAVPQSMIAEQFDRASEFGVPTGSAVPPAYLKLGYTLGDYDKVSRLSWKFLRDSTSEQVRAQLTRLIEGDKRLRQGIVFGRLFSAEEETNEWQHRCFGLWSGDGIVPPPYMGKTFDGTHSHYLASGSATLDSGDVEGLITHVKEHGYGVDPKSQLVILANPTDGDEISTWRAGVENANSQKARWDFIPSALMPAWISNEAIHGAVPNADFHGLAVQGSYGSALLVCSELIPAGYVAVVATSGPNSDSNPLAVRHHENPAYRGLRSIPGPVPGYPLQETFMARSIGVGTRHRGAAAVCQITASATYTAPELNF